MQLFSRKKALVALSLGASFALGACGDDVTVPVAPDAPVVVSITPPNATMNIGESLTFAVQITGGSSTTPPTVTSCTSSNNAVATTATATQLPAGAAGGGCRVTAVASGNVTITATASTGGQAAASVTVAPAAAAISGLSTSPTSASVAVGQSLTIVPNVTKAGAAVAVTYGYATSSASVATVTNGVVVAVAPGTATITVTATGSATGFTTAVLTSGVTITVTPAPPAINSLTVSPMSLAMAVGNTAQLAASTSAAAGVTPTITYASNTPATATVGSTTGLVTAVAGGTAQITVTATAAGTATLSASTLTAVVAVTVTPPANVTIASVTQGPTMSTTSGTAASNDGIMFSANGQVNQPVDQANVRDQIQVNVNLETNNQLVSSVRVYVCKVDLSDCGAGAVPAAEQTFANNQANTSTIQLLINTADFTADFAAGSAMVKYNNGQRVIRSSVRLPNGTETFAATNNAYILNFNNIDGWAARFDIPSRTATRTIGTTSWNYFGGPGATGGGTVRPVAVFYTPGRSVQSVNVGMSNCGGNMNFVAATGFATTYGAGSAFNVSCSGYEHGQTAASDYPQVRNTQDNSNNPAPTISFAAGYRTSAAVPAVQQIRLDYAGPSFSISNPTTLWASGALNNFNWRTSTSAPTDGGVGPLATSTFTYTYSGCGATAVAMATAGAADIPECATDFTTNVYQVSGTGTDALTNSTTSSTSASPNRFAIDNIAPVIRYTVGSASIPATPLTPGAGTGSFADTTTFTASALTGTGFAFTAVPVAADSIFAADALDERSGLTTASNVLARANQANSTGACQRGTVPTGGIGAAFISAPACVYAAVGFGNTLADGWKQIVTRIYGSDFGIGGTPVEGYYTYSARTGDRAGNTATLPFRRILFNNSTPAMTGLGLPSTVTAAGPNVFTPNFTEAVEGWVSNLAVGYGSALGTANLLDPTVTNRATILFPATLMNARFNDAIGLNGNYNTGTPFASGNNFYTNIEYSTNPAGTINGAAVSRPDSAYARVINAGGNPSAGGNNASQFFAVQLLSGNVGNDATSWTSFNGNLQSWTLGTIPSAWNAPANGVKAIVTANTNQINSPFTRIDYYEFQVASPTTVGGAAGGQWVYIGSVDGTATPCVSAGSTCPVYIADNGTTRVWTYRLTVRTNGVNGLAAGSVLTNLVTAGSARFMAVASNGTKGRVLATNPAAAVSLLPNQ